MSDNAAGRPVTARHDTRDVLEHIRAHYDHMSKSQKKVAEFWLTHGIDVVYLSASRVAELLDVDRSTVVRTAQALGYAGFTELQADLQHQLLKRFSTTDRVRMDMQRLQEALEDDASPPGDSALLASMARSEIKDLEDLVQRIPEADFTRAVDLLASSRRVYVLGLRGSLPLAMSFAFMLRHVRDGCHLLEGKPYDFSDQLIDLTADDLLFTISYIRYARDTIRCMDYARQVGASIITLTDSPVSPAAKRADLTFVLLFRMYFYRMTSAPLVLLNGLTAALAARQMTSAQAQSERLDAIYRDMNVFFTDDDG